MSLSPEDRIILWIISLGIAIGLFLYIGGNVTGAIQPSPILVAVFIALGFSAAIYRFLGGLSGSGMSIGPAKLAGTAAAFLAITWFLNQSLEKQWVGIGSPISIVRQSIGISPSDWFAVDTKSGNPVEVKVTLNDSVVKTIQPYSPAYPERNLILDKASNGNFAFAIKALSGSDSLILGGLHQSELSKNKLFRSFADKDNNLFTSDNLPPGSKNISIAPELPFLLNTGAYSQDLTRFSLVDRQTKELLLPEANIRLRGGKIFEVKNRVFLILITQVDHTGKGRKEEPYAKFGVIELNPT
ncbi:MAG: hypothetical protein R2828_09970 [Saprospiraceae bacterium]